MNPKSPSASAAMNRDLTERYFMNKYHWTPCEINKIPYQWIQRYFIIEDAKDSALDQKRQIDEIKNQLKK